MNYLVGVFLLTMVALSSAARELYPRGCIYIDGRCFQECPEGTHSYTTGCGRKTPEPTCEEPHPVPEEGDICDYSACYCDPPTVRNTALDKCVPLEECPKEDSSKLESKPHED